jgi:hypothetical protein
MMGMNWARKCWSARGMLWTQKCWPPKGMFYPSSAGTLTCVKSIVTFATVSERFTLGKPPC